MNGWMQARGSSSSRPSGSGRPGPGPHTAWLARGTAARASLTRSARSAGVSRPARCPGGTATYSGAVPPPSAHSSPAPLYPRGGHRDFFAVIRSSQVRLEARIPVNYRLLAGSLRASCRFPVDVEEFEPKVLDSVEEAVQGGLVGSGAPQHRRIAHGAHLRVVEGCPHPGTSDTAEGDHVGTVGYISRRRHSCREPPDGVSCPHPLRVCRSVVA
jgi:hypothetical protein